MTTSRPSVGGSPIKRFALTEQERRGLLFTTIRGLPAQRGSWLIVSCSSPLALSEDWAAPTSLSGLADPIEVSAAVAGRPSGNVDALAWRMQADSRLTRGQRKELREAGVDHVLRRGADMRLEAMDVGRAWSRTRGRGESRGSVAATIGPSLGALLDRLLPTGSELPVGLAGVDDPGWVAVPTGLACPSCDDPLIRVDHHYPGLRFDSTRQALVCRSGRRHGQARAPSTMLTAHRQLSAAVSESAVTAAGPRRHRVYVIESRAVADDSLAYYVGETAKPPEDRFEQHRSGGDAARAFAGGAYVPVRLRPDLVPDLPELPSRLASQAAEQFTAAALRWRGLPVLGGT